MAIYDHIYLYHGYQVLIMVDPNRYRATIWARDEDNTHHSKLVRTMIDTDRVRLVSRVKDYLDRIYTYSGLPEPDLPDMIDAYEIKIFWLSATEVSIAEEDILKDYYAQGWRLVALRPTMDLVTGLGGEYISAGYNYYLERLNKIPASDLPGLIKPGEGSQ